MAEVLITIKPTGETHVEAVGYQGASCSLATAPYIHALGVANGQLPKPEMFQEQAQHQEVQQ
jgi:hypothetical protein